MQGTIISLRFKERRGAMRETDALTFVAGDGIEGDFHRGNASRQVLLLDKATLDEFGYSPGTLREQVLVDFPNLQSLSPGTRLNIGTAEVEITADCAPCLTMAGYVNEDGVDFVNKMMGRRGMLAKVTKSGAAKAGDSVKLSE